MRSKNLLKKKLANIYEDISKKTEKNEMMHLQTDQEFQQNKIKKLNLKFNVKMFSSRIRGGKALEAKQNICEFKKLLFKRKKIISSSKRLDSKKIIQKTTDNLNSIATSKYGYPPDEVEKKSLESRNLEKYLNFID